MDEKQKNEWVKAEREETKRANDKKGEFPKSSHPVQ